MQLQPKQSRTFNKIEYSNSVRKANLTCRRGHETETSSLNINLHTLAKKQLLSSRYKWSSADRKAIEEYASDKGNFSSTKRLYGPAERPRKEIRKAMLKIYSGSQMTLKVLANDNMEFFTKIVFIKFLEKVRTSASKPEQHRAWKQK